MKKADKSITLKKARGWLKNSLGKKGLLLLLLLLLTVGPVFSAVASSKPSGSTEENGLLQTTGAILETAKIYLAGEEIQPVRNLPEDQIADALASLNEFNAAVLKDPRLAAILDEIIWDLVGSEQFTEGIQERTEFLADIVRDERLIALLGEVIADYLRDERLAGDIEYFFSIVFDLLSDPEMHFYIRETVAAVLNNPQLENMINDVLTGVIDLGYGSVIDMIVDIVMDQRVTDLIFEAAAVLLDSLPDMVGVVEDSRVEALAEEMILIMLEYGSDTAVNVLDDERLRVVLADLLVLSVQSAPMNAIVSDLAEHAMGTIGIALGDGTINNVVGDLVNQLFLGEIDYIDVPGVGYVPVPIIMPEGFFDPQDCLGLDPLVRYPATTRYHEIPSNQATQYKNSLRDVIDDWFGYRFPNNAALDAALRTVNYGSDTQLWLYFHDALNHVISQSMSYSRTISPPDHATLVSGSSTLVNQVYSNAGDMVMNHRRLVAESVAEVPGEMMRDAFFTWLVHGVPLTDMHGYSAWAKQYASLLSSEDMEVLGNTLVNSTKNILDDFFAEHKDDINTALRKAVLELPWDEAIGDIRDQENEVGDAVTIIVKKLFESLPLDGLAKLIRLELEDAQLGSIVEDIIGDVPFERAGTLLRYDKRIIDVIHDSNPGFSLGKVADIIKNDTLLVAVIADNVSQFPVSAVTGFLQDETRSALIGDTVAHMLLNLVADFIDDSRMAVFVNDAIINLLGNFDGSPGGALLDFLSSFLDHEVFAAYLVTAAPVKYGIQEELIILYKEAVPKFFTNFIWNWRSL